MLLKCTSNDTHACGICFVCLESENTLSSNICCGDLIYHDKCLTDYCKHRVENNDVDYDSDDENWNNTDNKHHITCPICKKSIGYAININKYKSFSLFSKNTAAYCIYTVWIFYRFFGITQYYLVFKNSNSVAFIVLN